MVCLPVAEILSLGIPTFCGQFGVGGRGSRTNAVHINSQFEARTRMSITNGEVLSTKARFMRCLQSERSAASDRGWAVLLVAFLTFVPSILSAQSFVPTFTVGAGIQTNYDHLDTSGLQGVDDFPLDHARLYFSGDVTKNISVMFNTDYSSASDNMEILDAVGEFHESSEFNVWFGRFLPPSDRANLYGPFYANEWSVYTDGVQDGYPFVFQGRDNGVAYWGDFKAGVAKIKVSTGAFSGPSADGVNSVIWASRVQIDFWDPEDGYYLNGTYYGDKNLLAIGGATQVQNGHTATTADFLMERKVPKGGAFTIESEYSRYNGLGGYNSYYGRSEGAYVLASFLIPKKVGIGKFEVLGKYANAEFTDGLVGGPSYRQKTPEINFDYIIEQFNARLMSFYRNTSFNAVEKNNWEVGVGIQLQISKTFSRK
jgi:hypothetical protein